jgi:hypothetical protein
MINLAAAVTPADFAASLVERCRAMDVEALTAAAAEAAQTAAYLGSTGGSMHSTPRVRTQLARRAAAAAAACQSSRQSLVRLAAAKFQG